LLEGNFGIPSSINLSGDKKKKDKEPVATVPQKVKISPKLPKEETIGIELG